ncbi:endonuclease [Flavobacterium frigoris]|uniref:Por secretion system C-terminal sorting domain-containing protein n=1 Tax=Flavobacterium frigoris TaxID=229204 RepID=A0A1H9JY38_FLAFI|nr:endonuclease [Flavobacterium frigoris]SEQ91727.1 Por secretion system C-terminal sorting domain-containing protein [Flavobacterium frigoris]
MKQIYMKKQLLLATVFSFLSLLSFGQVPSYYNGTNINQTGNALKSSLATLISSNTTILSYTPGVWDALKQTDLDPTDPSKVLLIYGYNDTDSDITNDRTRSKDLNGGNQGNWNREHVYAKSLGNPNLGTDGPGSDAHHLRASDITLNSTRNNYPYGSGTGNSKLINGAYWYPGDEWKGDVARMVMYMYVRYGNQCLPNAVTVGSQTFSGDIPDILLQWNVEDPVSQIEINRNTILEGVQGNRNPFIDNPAFATTIWGGPQAENRFDGSVVFDTEVPSVPANLYATNTTQTGTTLTWVQSTDNVGVLGYRIYNGTVQIASSSTANYVLSGLTANTNYTFSIKAFDAAGNISNGSNSIAVTTLAGTPPPTPTTSVVFMNEIHYDNASTDVGEGIEIAGTAGTDLTGWSIIPYNGNGGASYTPAGSLSGIIPNQSNGFGTVFVAVNGLQNGAPDGLALVNNLGNVIQFLSYEGTFAATNGPANGMTSTDIGVSQNGTEAIGLSLQLKGSGTQYSDFTWQAASASTYGNINNGQSFSTTTVPLTNPTNLAASNTTQTTTTLSWEAGAGAVSYEIFNGTTKIAATTNTNFTLTNLTANTTYRVTVLALDADDNTSDASNEIIVTTLENATTPALAGSVFINEIHYDNAGSDIDEGVEITGLAGTDLTGWKLIPYNGNGGASYTPIGTLSGTIPNQLNGYGTVSVPLSGLQNGAPDGIALVDAANNVIQFLSYEGSFTATNGPASGMTSTDIGIAEAGTATLGTSLQLVGKGTKYVDFTWEAAVSTFGKVNVGQKFGDLVFINEIHYDNAGTDLGEAVEVAGYAGTDLTGWSIIPYNGTGGATYTPIGTLSGIIPDQLNGYGTVSVSIAGLQNGSPDGIALVDPSGKLIQFLSYEGSFTATNGPASGMTSTDISIAEASTAAVGTSLQLTGAGFTYADFTWQAANNTFGAINAGQFFGNASDIIVVLPIAEARAKADGEIVTVTGVLTVSDQFAGSAYIQDATGAIAVFDKTVHGAGIFKIGDSITVTGTRSSYSDQLQISPVSAVTNNGLPNQAIQPKTITLSEMVNHPAELVRIQNTTFPKPGTIMFGNSNTNITDANGTAQLRIDADVNDLVGFAQPETCSEIIGVVGNYFATQQLLPRMRTDFQCADKYQQTGSDLAISKDKTLDIATWNVAWFGDETNSPAAGKPNSDMIQKEAVKTILQQLDADIYAVEEVSDDALLAQMVSEMNDYSFVLSEATSYPFDVSGPKQKVGFIYKNKTVEAVSTKVLLKTIHPYYNGGDESALANYPNTDKSRFFASGRLPFMLTANVTIDGNKKQINIIDLHARANTSGDAQGKYDMRKFDVEVLKDTLDAQYQNANLILLGDYNDDVDYTVSDVTTTVSTYEAYVNDAASYNVVTKTLSEQGFRSYATYENMIDHITLSNELADLYIDQSARVHYEFFSSDYTKTASDHFPVTARLQLKLMEVESLNVTNAMCNGEANGTATINVSGGISPYTYLWSTNATTSTITALTAGNYSVAITDALNHTITKDFTVTEADAIDIPSAEEVTVYNGYKEKSCTTLSATGITGGIQPYSYKWSNGATTNTIKVCPEQTTTFTLTVTDANGCTAVAERTVNVEDVRCGNNTRNPKVEICHNGRSICVDENAVKWHLAHGDTLGSCTQQDNNQVRITNVNVFPNPFVNNVNVSLTSSVTAKVDFWVYNFFGQLVYQSSNEISAGKSISNLELSTLRKGFYFLKTVVNGKLQNIKYLVKK